MQCEQLKKELPAGLCPNGEVEARIRARELILQGHLTGVLQVACRVVLHLAAIVVSSIRAGALAIEEAVENATSA